MNPLGFLMPLYSIVFVLISVLMGAGCFLVFDALRYTHCAPWLALAAPPRQELRLSGALGKTLYVQAAAGEIYCHTANRWTPCSPPSMSTLSDDAPDWIKVVFNSLPEEVDVAELRRSENVLSVDYYALTKNGEVWSCSTRFPDEMERLVRSPAALWLLLPGSIGLWSAAVAFNIFVSEGRPVWSDFWGRLHDYWG